MVVLTCSPWICAWLLCEIFGLAELMLTIIPPSSLSDTEEDSSEDEISIGSLVLGEPARVLLLGTCTRATAVAVLSTAA
jgi:hypothetical protein